MQCTLYINYDINTDITFSSLFLRATERLYGQGNAQSVLGSH